VRREPFVTAAALELRFPMPVIIIDVKRVILAFGFATLPVPDKELVTNVIGYDLGIK
jgi:hypothetical protein